MWILALVAIAGIVLEIVILVKFFQLCQDVSNMKNSIQRNEARPISAVDVKKAIVMGTTDEAYKRIIGRLYDDIVKNPKATTVSNRIAYAENLCGMMGRELPAQLKSADAVISFLTLQANEEGLLEKKVGDTVFRIGDGKVVVITATDGTSFNCVDPATGQFVGIYSDKDLYKAM